MLAVGLTLCACNTPSGQPADIGDWPPGLGMPGSTGRTLKILHNHGFTIGYDAQRRQAAWVAYRVTPIHGFDAMTRPEFTADPRLARAPVTGVYAGPRYDRGHLAPNYAIRQLYGVEAQRQTFYYSNIAPQRPRLNQLVWQRLEEIESDEIGPMVGTLWVLVGPIAAGQGAPAAFYRIWLARDPSGRWQALAFRVPQTVRGDERLDRFIVSVDAIEAATGLDFFTGLAGPRESALEAQPASAETFGFAEYACLPARYGKRWQTRDGIDLRYDRCHSR